MRLVASLRATAQWLAKKGPEEFSRTEIRQLQLLGKLLSHRLYGNALTKIHQGFLSHPEKYRRPNGGYSIDLDPKDLLIIESPEEMRQLLTLS